MYRTAVIVSSLSLLLACSGEDSDSPMTTTSNLLPGASGLAAVGPAQDLWRHITLENDYRAWALVPNTTARQPGMSPHGAFVTMYYSGGSLAAPMHGLMIVKENYAADGVTLGAVTVMSRAAGFDPQNADWFYAKYLPTGALDTTPSGLPLAGAVEPAPGMACRGCHRNAVGADFMFSNDLAPAPPAVSTAVPPAVSTAVPPAVPSP